MYKVQKLSNSESLIPFRYYGILILFGDGFCQDAAYVLDLKARQVRLITAVFIHYWQYGL
jgi:hypothetical protein